MTWGAANASSAVRVASAFEVWEFISRLRSNRRRNFRNKRLGRLAADAAAKQWSKFGRGVAVRANRRRRGLQQGPHPLCGAHRAAEAVEVDADHVARISALRVARNRADLLARVGVGDEL